MRRMGGYAKALPRRVGRRGAFLLFLFLLDVVYAYGLLFPSQETRNSRSFRFLADVMPLRAWAVLVGAHGIPRGWAHVIPQGVGLGCLFYLVSWVVVEPARPGLLLGR